MNTYNFGISQDIIIKYFRNNSQMLPKALQTIDTYDWDMLLFFLNKPSFEHIDFFYWDYVDFLDVTRTYKIEEALKALTSLSNDEQVVSKIKALYEQAHIPFRNRQVLNKTTLEISMGMIHLILRCFKNNSYLQSALLDTSLITQHVDFELTYWHLYDILMFFRKWYSDDEIITLFTPTEDIPFPGRDTMFYTIVMLYDEYNDVIEEHFVKGELSIYGISDTFHEILERYRPEALNDFYQENTDQCEDEEHEPPQKKTFFKVLYTWINHGKVIELDSFQSYADRPTSKEQLYRNIIDFGDKNWMLFPSIKDIFTSYLKSVFRKWLA